MKKIKLKIMVLILLFTCTLLSAIDISDIFIKNVDTTNDLDDFYTDSLHTNQPPISSKTWWNSLYIYRAPINITNTDTNNLPKGYSVNIAVNTTKLISTGKLRDDGDDLRVVWYNSTSKTWLELDRVNDTNFNTPDTQIWFKTQGEISSGISDINYYLYYGNPDAFNPPINKSKIYDFYDDFTQSDGPANGWTVTQGTGWSVVNNEYRENQAATDLRTILNTYTVENATIEVRIKHVGVGTMFGAGVLFRYSDGNNFYTSGGEDARNW